MPTERAHVHPKKLRGRCVWCPCGERVELPCLRDLDDVDEIDPVVRAKLVVAAPIKRGYPPVILGILCPSCVRMIDLEANGVGEAQDHEEPPADSGESPT